MYLSLVGGDVVIEAFEVSPDSAPGNTDVTFTWEIEGEFSDGSIWWVPNTARPTLTSITLVDEPSGSFTFSVPDWTYGEYTFTLYLLDSSNIQYSAETTLNIECTYRWEVVSQAEGCPIDAAQTVSAAYQTFERGVMVWLPGSIHAIWVLYNDGSFDGYRDAWDGSSPVQIDETPPSGMRAPERGFGYLWADTPHIQERLGWALSEEVSYPATFQRNIVRGRYGSFFTLFTLPDGRVVNALRETGSLPSWSYANP
jgi:hypothetical protein